MCDSDGRPGHPRFASSDSAGFGSSSSSSSSSSIGFGFGSTGNMGGAGVGSAGGGGGGSSMAATGGIPCGSFPSSSSALGGGLIGGGAGPHPLSSSLSAAESIDDHLHQHLHQHQQRRFHNLPNLFHSLSHHGASVLAITVDESAHTAYTASQSECIVVWDLLTLQERTRLEGHTASVLALELALDKGWLFSSSGDNTVRIWDIHSHQPVAVLYPAEDNVGDIFSLQWSQHLQTLYVGCQNTSIQWISLESVPASAALPVPSKPHKFFDSVPVALRRRRQREEAHSMYAASSNMGSPGSNYDPANTTLTSSASRPLPLSTSQESDLGGGAGLSFGTSFSTGKGGQEDCDLADEEEEENVVHLQFSSECIVPYAHFGYVYSLLLFYPDNLWYFPSTQFSDDLNDSTTTAGFSDTLPESTSAAAAAAAAARMPILASASGDEHIKLWNCLPDGSLVLRATLHNAESDSGGILTLSHRPNTLLAGTQAGTIDIWDLETLTTVRTLRAHADDVLSLSSIVIGDEVACFSAGADGEVRRWDGQFGCTASWRAHEGLALACVPIRLGSGSTRVITGGSDDLVKLWDFPLFGSPASSSLGGGGGAGHLVGSPAGFHGPVGLGGFGGGTGLGGAFGSVGTPPAYLHRTSSYASMGGGGTSSSAANFFGPTANNHPTRPSFLSNPSSSIRNSLLTMSTSASSITSLGAGNEPDIILSALARFVAFRTVSSDETFREECRQCAHWLKGCLTQLGAETMLLPGAPRRNPLVLATFRGSGSGAVAGDGKKRKRCLFYGHYDVVDDDSGAAAAVAAATAAAAAVERSHGLHHHMAGRPGLAGGLHQNLSVASTGSKSPFNRPRGGSGSLNPNTPNSTLTPTTTSTPNAASTPQPASQPWTLTGRDGYLYGRGASDNKGPILGVACAAAELLARRELEMDVVMLIEGEEEVGSVGLAEAVRKARAQIGDIDVILLSNSYWLGEETPCITMGLRGVIHATIEICGPDKDVHSGVEGGALREPMIDMIRLLSTLSDGDEVLIPSFYDAVRPVTAEERAAFTAIASMERRGQRNLASHTHTHPKHQPPSNPAATPAPPASPTPASTESLIARWCRPSLSIHRLGVSGSGNATVIPSKVEAAVSLRIVPDMDAEKVGEALEAHVLGSFEALRSSNRARVRIDHRADWWLGEETSPYSQALADAIEAEWGEAPVSIREGGSIPAMALLEKELGAPAVHLPMGQSSDNAHLPGERIRLMNLQKGRAVVRRFLEALPALA